MECQENHGVETLAGARGRAKVLKETSLMGMWQAHFARPSLGWTRRYSLWQAQAPKKFEERPCAEATRGRRIWQGVGLEEDARDGNTTDGRRWRGRNLPYGNL